MNEVDLTWVGSEAWRCSLLRAALVYDELCLEAGGERLEYFRGLARELRERVGANAEAD